ncbi:hypothetical protein Vadar_021933 [Vaccinium darrowii]|uniref:Uncharacterized protein n=1 Tax=Vaccinium darrowii TaxID=229202 RepID=A0ACB7Z5G4_9ERIC|nr:hypothetical protein Vadar_021933 [Vaccinium darrowii]
MPLASPKLLTMMLAIAISMALLVSPGRARVHLQEQAEAEAEAQAQVQVQFVLPNPLKCWGSIREASFATVEKPGPKTSTEQDLRLVIGLNAQWLWRQVIAGGDNHIQDGTSFRGCLREISSIKTLDLSGNHGLHGAVHNLTNLSSIETLFMNDVILDDDFLLNIRIMTSIQVLSLRDCELNGLLSIKGLCEMKTLWELDVTRTSFGGALPWCLLNSTSLRLLDITSNHFNGNIAQSDLINLTSLEYLSLSNNDFEIPISFKSFFSHSKLKFVESMNNKLLEDQEDIFATP